MVLGEKHGTNYLPCTNIWNAYSYLRWRVENVWGQR